MVLKLEECRCETTVAVSKRLYLILFVYLLVYFLVVFNKTPWSDTSKKTCLEISRSRLFKEVHAYGNAYEGSIKRFGDHVYGEMFVFVYFSLFYGQYNLYFLIH